MHVCARVITLCSMVFFAACGTTVKIEGNADRVWAVTLSTLRVAHAMSDADERQASEGGVPRPRIDRAAGEIDLPYRGDFYRGESALYVVVDVSKPERVEPRSVRFGIDSELGNFVVRQGRALDKQATEAFGQKFLIALKIAEGMHPASVVLPVVEATKAP